MPKHISGSTTAQENQQQPTSAILKGTSSPTTSSRSSSPPPHQPPTPVSKTDAKWDQSSKENVNGPPTPWKNSTSPSNFKRVSSGLKSPRPSEEELKLFSQPLPPLRDASNHNEQRALFLKKLELCSVQFDFTGPYANAFEKEKEIKRKTLLELVEFAETKSGVFTPETYGPVISMIASNIFRSLPPKVQPACQAEAPVEELEEEPRPDPAWPHLLPVYTLFLEFVVSRDTDPKVSRYPDSNSWIIPKYTRSLWNI